MTPSTPSVLARGPAGTGLSCHCERGHLVRAGLQFCAICGSADIRPGVVAGHPIEVAG